MCKLIIHRRQTNHDSLYSQGNKRTSFPPDQYSWQVFFSSQHILVLCHQDWPQKSLWFGFLILCQDYCSGFKSLAPRFCPLMWSRHQGIHILVPALPVLCVSLNKAVSSPSFLPISLYSLGALWTTKTRLAILWSCFMFSHFHFLLIWVLTSAGGSLFLRAPLIGIQTRLQAHWTKPWTLLASLMALALCSPYTVILNLDCPLESHVVVVVRSLNCRVLLFATSWTATHQAAVHCLPEFAQTHVHWVSDAI